MVAPRLALVVPCFVVIDAPPPFVSSIEVDPANANHVWISYSGSNFNTTAIPGHVFSVTWDLGPGTATWTALDGGSGPFW